MLKTVVDLRKTAVGTCCQRIWQGVGNLVEVLLGKHIVVGGKGAGKMGSLLRRLAQMDVGIFALVIAASFAGMAFTAGNVISGYDAVAGLHRLSGIVDGDAFTQNLNTAYKFMALTALGGARAHGTAALPVLHVRAADVAAENPHQHGTGFRVR